MGIYEQERNKAMDEVYRKAAQDVLRDLKIVMNEPVLDPSPTELSRFKWLDLAWYEKAAGELETLGFRRLRDLDATALTAHGSPPIAVRVMLSEDGRTSAALYQAIPRSPGFFVKAIMWLMRQWKKPKVIELTSYTKDGRVYNTSNQGEVNHFSPSPNNSRKALPLSASVREVHAAHQTHMESSNAVFKSFREFDELNAAREEQREKQNAWRRDVGLLPEELDRMLAPHGANGVALRPYIVEALRQAGLG